MGVALGTALLAAVLLASTELPRDCRADDTSIGAADHVMRQRDR